MDDDKIKNATANNPSYDCDSDIAKNSTVVYLGLGSNLGDRSANIARAVEKISCHAQIELIIQSTFYETKAQIVEEQPDFINACLAIMTTLSPQNLLAYLLDIERQMGRIRTIDKGPRIIDIDILFYGDEHIDEPNLQIPHPGVYERDFVLIPLAEIAPSFRSYLP